MFRLFVVGQSGVGDVGPCAGGGRFDAGLLLPRVGGVGAEESPLAFREGRLGLVGFGGGRRHGFGAHGFVELSERW